MLVPYCSAMRLPVTEIGVPAVPNVTPGLLEDVPLPACTRMPAPEGKFVIVLLLIVAPLILPAALAVPRTPTRIADPSELAADVLLVKVFPLMSRLVIVPPNCWMSTP